MTLERAEQIVTWMFRRMILEELHRQGFRVSSFKAKDIGGAAKEWMRASPVFAENLIWHVMATAES